MLLLHPASSLPSSACFASPFRNVNGQFTPLSFRVQAFSSNSAPKVVVTREQGKNEKLIDALSAHGITCLELPLIQHSHGPDFEKLPATLRNTLFDWVVITSPEAGAVFLEAWRKAGRPNVKVGVVGGGTASVFNEVSDSSLDVCFTPSKATGKVLASELPKGENGSSRVLYPASLKASNDIEEGLSNRGFEVVRMNTYTTEGVVEVDREVLEKAILVPVVAVGSPSAIRSWVHLISDVEWNNCVACIGETTAFVAKRLGLKNVFHPPQPGLDGWVSTILEALKSQGFSMN